jgi:hypothetical protein
MGSISLVFLLAEARKQSVQLLLRVNFELLKSSNSNRTQLQRADEFRACLHVFPVLLPVFRDCLVADPVASAVTAAPSFVPFRGAFGLLHDGTDLAVVLPSKRRPCPWRERRTALGKFGTFLLIGSVAYWLCYLLDFPQNYASTRAPTPRDY